MEFDFTPVEDITKVPEPFRGMFAQGEDGKFAVSPEFKGTADAVVGLNRSLKAARLEAKNKAVDLSPLAEFGDNPATIREAITAAIEAAGASKNQDVTKQIEGVKTALTTAHQTELTKRDARNTALQSQLYGLLVENAATSAVAELKGVPDLLLPFIKTQVKVIEQDGNLIPQVADVAGEVRYGATGQPMTIKELVAEMKGQEKYGRLFESEASNGGGGMQPGAGRQAPRAPAAADKTSTGKIAAGLNNRMRGPRR